MYDEKEKTRSKDGDRDGVQEWRTSGRSFTRAEERGCGASRERERPLFFFFFFFVFFSPPAFSLPPLHCTHSHHQPTHAPTHPRTHTCLPYLRRLLLVLPLGERVVEDADEVVNVLLGEAHSRQTLTRQSASAFLKRSGTTFRVVTSRVARCLRKKHGGESGRKAEHAHLRRHCCSG